MDIELKQRGRASIDFVAAVGGALRRARAEVSAEVEAAGISNDSLSEDFDERCRQFETAVASVPGYPAFAAIREWMSVNHGRIAVESFDEVRSEVVPALEALRHGPTTLEASLGGKVPDYFRGVSFHRSGAWDSHDYMGVVHGEILHRRLVARNFGGNIYEQRRGMLDELLRHDYARILEIGTSSGNLTLALSERFPTATVTGVDLSLRMLEQAQRIGNERGRAWRLFQRAAEATGFPNASFNLVAGYALGHEVPEAVIHQILREAYRVLEPGGELLLGDVVPYLAQDRLAQCWADHEAQRGGEPYWREYCRLDLAAVAAAAGFADPRYFAARGPRRFPFILHARKPAAA